jgi:AcrR family transcriptional regulator
MPVAANPRHQQLLDGLVELFLAEGFAQFTLADLADRMRCSKSTLYALGHSKEAVVLNVLARFFSQATEQVEQQTAREADPSARIVGYLRAVADALRPASPGFIADVAGHPAARSVYRRNTGIAAERVKKLVSDGEHSGSFRAVDAAFVADTVTATMERIQSGEVTRNTGLSDAQAYDELAGLVLKGIAS